MANARLKNDFFYRVDFKTDGFCIELLRFLGCRVTAKLKSQVLNSEPISEVKLIFVLRQITKLNVACSCIKMTDRCMGHFSQKVLIKSFCRSQLPHKSVNVS